jgi:RimJ/RimL family protein N-acetyltransferase
LSEEPLQLHEAELSDGVVALRIPRAEDAPELARGVRDPAVVRYASVPWGGDSVGELAEKIDTAWPEAAQAGRSLNLAITDAPTDDVIGYFVVFEVNRRHSRCEVGFMLFPEARGRGATTRAIELACRWAYSQNFVRVQASTDVANVAAQRTLVKAGFTREGVLRSYIPAPDGTRCDFEMYSRLASD